MKRHERLTLRIVGRELPSFPNDHLWSIGRNFEVARLLVEYVADMNRRERSEVWG